MLTTPRSVHISKLEEHSLEAIKSAKRSITFVTWPFQHYRGKKETIKEMELERIRRHSAVCGQTYLGLKATAQRTDIKIQGLLAVSARVLGCFSCHQGEEKTL